MWTPMAGSLSQEALILDADYASDYLAGAATKSLMDFILSYNPVHSFLSAFQKLLAVPPNETSQPDSEGFSSSTIYQGWEHAELQELQAGPTLL